VKQGKEKNPDWCEWEVQQGEKPGKALGKDWDSLTGSVGHLRAQIFLISSIIPVISFDKCILFKERLSAKGSSMKSIWVISVLSSFKLFCKSKIISNKKLKQT